MTESQGDGTYRCPRCEGEFPESALGEDRECVWCGQTMGEFDIPSVPTKIRLNRKVGLAQSPRVVETRVSNDEDEEKSLFRRLFE